MINLCFYPINPWLREWEAVYIESINVYDITGELNQHVGHAW